MSARRMDESGKVMACQKCLDAIEKYVVRARSMALSLTYDDDETLTLAGSIAGDLDEAKSRLRDIGHRGTCKGGPR